MASRNGNNGAGSESLTAQVAAAAFLESLAPQQRGIAVRGYNKTAATRWSNLPVEMAPRVGIRLGDLNASQTAAANALLRRRDFAFCLYPASALQPFFTQLL